MNIIQHWAHLLDESYNPDDRKSDRMDMEADKWEELQNQIAEINKKLDKKSVSEAEDEDDDPDYVSPLDDPEFEKHMKNADAGLNDLKAASDRNERLANGQGTEDDKDYIKATKDEDDVSSGKKWFVFEVIDEYEFGNTKAEIQKAKDLEDAGSLKPGKTLFNKISTESFTSEEEAKEYVKNEIDKYSNKYGITSEDFKRLHDKVEIKYTFMDKKAKSEEGEGKKKIRTTAQVGAIPHEILDVDPDAIGFLYASSDTDGDGKVYGVDKGGQFEKPDENEDNRQLLMEFICYRSFYPVYKSSGMLELHDKIRQIDDTNYKTQEQIRKEKEAQFKEEMAKMEEDMFEEAVGQIEKFIASNDEEVLSDIIGQNLDGMSAEDIGNLTAEDIEKFGKQKAFDILDAIWKYNEKKSDEKHDKENVKTSKSDVSSEVIDFLNNETDKEKILKVFKPFFPVKKTGNEEEDKKENERVENMVRNLTVDGLKDFSNEKIMAARGRIWRLKDGKYLDKDEKVDFGDDNDTKSGVDGYETRSDGKEDEESDSEDNEETTGNDRRNDDDLDDYEGSQNNTGARYSDNKQRTKEDSTMKLHGVKLSKRVWDALKSIPKDKMPKNADEVRKFAKEVVSKDK